MLIGIISRVRLTTDVAGLSRLTAIIQWLIICSLQMLFTEKLLKELQETEAADSERGRLSATDTVHQAVTAVISARVLFVLTAAANASAETLFPVAEVIR